MKDLKTRRVTLANCSPGDKILWKGAVEGVFEVQPFPKNAGTYEGVYVNLVHVETGKGLFLHEGYDVNLIEQEG